MSSETQNSRWGERGTAASCGAPRQPLIQPLPATTAPAVTYHYTRRDEDPRMSGIQVFSGWRHCGRASGGKGGAEQSKRAERTQAQRVQAIHGAKQRRGG